MRPACVRHLSALLALAAPPLLVRHLSALCCWLWPRLHVLVRYLSALCCWLWTHLQFLVRHLSALCPPCVVGFGRASMSLSATCSPNSLLWGSLRKKRLAAKSPPCVRLDCALAAPHVSALSAMCPPLSGCLRLGSALAASPHFVRHVSGLCPAGHVPARPLSPLWPRLQTLSAPLVSALRVSTMCPLCQLRSAMRPRLWTLSARGLLWGKYKIISQHCPSRRVYIACLLVSLSFLGIHFGSHIRPLQAHSMLEKLFGVYAGIIVHNLERS